MKKAIAVFLTVLLLTSTMLCFSFAAEIVDSGTCGENVTWTLDSNGLLTISGTGDLKEAPWDAYAVKTVVIENGVTSIGGEAFYRCTGLTSITIPNSVTSIGNEAFRGCSGLTSVAIPNSVTSIGEKAFSGCGGLKSITIPDSVTSIGESAFEYCRELKWITIPDSVTSIGFKAFHDTPWFENQPYGLVYAGKVAYQYKGEMPAGTDLVLKDDTTGIAGSAFSGCTGLTSITIPNSVTSIGWAVFDGCTGLRDVYYKGTEEQWAAIVKGKDNNPLQTATIHFNNADETPAVNVPGDVSGDGDVTAEDARLALRGAVGLESYEPGSAAFFSADADHDGTLTAGDARLILRAAVGLETFA